jgi:diaminopimelate epimerase
MTLHFYKYHGTGNDFILVDNRKGDIDLSTDQIAKLCKRRFGVGADGLMELRAAEGYDFRMVYYNADGREGSMCGNGGRCIVKFAQDLGIGLSKSNYNFLATDGEHEATIETDGWIRLKMNDVKNVDRRSGYELLNTGSPHFVKMVDNVAELDVVEEGRSIRYSDKFRENGVNVNFVETTGDSSIFVRTYERGVEDETYSCGTGVTASALMNAHNERGFNHVEVETLGGKLYVEFEQLEEDHFSNVWLSGPAIWVFEGLVQV